MDKSIGYNHVSRSGIREFDRDAYGKLIVGECYRAVSTSKSKVTNTYEYSEGPALIETKDSELRYVGKLIEFDRNEATFLDGYGETESLNINDNHLMRVECIEGHEDLAKSMEGMSIQESRDRSLSPTFSRSRSRSRSLSHTLSRSRSRSRDKPSYTISRKDRKDIRGGKCGKKSLRRKKNSRRN